MDFGRDRRVSRVKQLLQIPLMILNDRLSEGPIERRSRERRQFLKVR